MQQEITEDTHSLVSSDQIKRKIIDAILFHRSKRLWFSERSFRFNLTSGVGDYFPNDTSGLPSDLVEIVGNRLWVSLDGSETQVYPIYRIPTDTFEEHRAVDYVTDQPFRWDFWSGRLRLTPKPDNSLHILEGRYVRDIGVPRAEYSGSAWTFKTPDDANTLDGAYTSDWFGDGRMLIRHYATYLLHSEVLSDEPAANRSLQRWLEAKASIEDESEGKTAGAVCVVPTLGL